MSKTDSEWSRSPHTNGTAPKEHDWGERTIQGYEIRKGHRAPGYYKTDAYEIRNYFGIPEFRVEEFLESSKYARMCYPDSIVHERDPETTSSTKGTDVLHKGDRDSGKTTRALELALRLMEETPDVEESTAERVIWRGRSDGSGWLPFKHWATVWLPETADVDAIWMNEGEESELEPVEDLEDEVRAVRYYSDVFDLLDQLADHPTGTFNVVFPDPSFAGCEEATESLENVAGTLPFVPDWESEEDDGSDATPLIHWWFGFWFARKEHGPFVWMSLIFDEVGDWLEEGASQETSRLHDKIKSLRKVWAASRKRLMSMYFFAHKEKNVHWMIREEFKWRVHMPDNSPNPRMARLSSLPQGFSQVRMEEDIMSEQKIGTALCYTENEFSYFTWDDVPEDPEDEERWLSIKLHEPDDLPSDDVDEERELEFDDRIFGSWQNAASHRLYVKDPGEGSISVTRAEVIETLDSPVEGMDFTGTREADGYLEVLMNDDVREVVVARVPQDREPLKSGAGPAGVAD